MEHANDQQAENFDTELRKYSNESPLKDANSSEDLWAFPLSSWAYYHKLQQMEWIVQMGFELDVYQIDELGGMYWYVIARSKALLDTSPS